MRRLIGRCVEWVLDRLFTRYDIGRAGDVYLTRWVIWGQRFGPGRKVFLHHFHRGDSDSACHCHPWPFWSLILLGGYWEHTPAVGSGPDGDPRTQRLWYRVGRLLKRPAEWQHRVELPPGKKCWTVLWCGEKERSWYFWCARGPVHWKEFVEREERGEADCGKDVA